MFRKVKCGFKQYVNDVLTQPLTIDHFLNGVFRFSTFVVCGQRRGRGANCIALLEHKKNMPTLRPESTNIALFRASLAAKRPAETASNPTRGVDVY